MFRYSAKIPTLIVSVRLFPSYIGEAEFIDDLPVRSGELHGAFVLSSIANCSIKNLDPSPALVSLYFLHFHFSVTQFYILRKWKEW